MNKITYNFLDTSFDVTLRDEADSSVFNEIFKHREYRRVEDVVQSTADPIIDVGAHAGFFTLYCRALNKKVSIFAMEPEPNNLQILKQHIKDNKISKVKIVETALAGESGERNLLISPDSHNHKLNHLGELVVAASSWSDFCRKNKIDKVGLLKMDIEGGEYEVIKSLSAEDLASIKAIILEYHLVDGRNYKVIENKLRENGFGVQIFPSKFDKTMGFLFAKNKRI